LRKAVKLNPDDPRAHRDLGIAYEKTALNGPAETEFLVALSLAPQKVEARNRLGMIYLSAGWLGEAEKQFRLSVKTQRNDSGYCGPGEIYVRRGDRGAAQRAFQSAASINPEDSRAHFKLGALYVAQGQRAQALREYQAGLKNDPEDADALAAVQKLSAHVREK
jgi:Flp pilus assembly protein TadD